MIVNVGDEILERRQQERAQPTERCIRMLKDVLLDELEEEGLGPEVRGFCRADAHGAARTRTAENQGNASHSAPRASLHCKASAPLSASTRLHWVVGNSAITLFSGGMT